MESFIRNSNSIDCFPALIYEKWDG